MKEGWKYVTLSSVCENLFAGGDVPKNNFSKQKTKEYSIPIISNGIGSNSLYGYTDIAKVCKKSVTISARGTIGYATVQSSAFYPIVRLIVAIPDEKVIEAEFLKYAFNSMTFQSEGAAIPQLTIPMVKNRIIPVPPLSEQQQIVDFLDAEFAKIDELKNQAEQSLQNTKALFQAALKEMLTPKEGWKEYTIKDVCRIINGYAFPSSAFSTGDTNKVIKITNVGVGEFVFDNATVPSQYDSLNQFKVHENDIVIALTRTIISAGLKVCDVPKEYDGALVNQRVAALTANDKCDISFVRYFLRTETAIDYVLKHVNQLMQPNLSINDLKNMPIPMPSIYEQTKIVSRIDILSNKILTLQSNYTRTIQLCADLKQALLRQVFE